MGDFYNRGGGGLSATTITATTITADDLEVDGGTLSIDETNNRVGVGLTTPKTALTVEGPVTLKEQANADGNTAAYGQLWVKTATPNELHFTTDAGDDIQITSGTGIVSGSVSGAQTGITSVVNASLEIGRDADNRIKFGTDNQIIFEVDGGDNVIFKASGEIEASSLDISGDADIDGTLEADAITVGGTALNTVVAGVTVTNATNAVNATHVTVTDNESTNEENLIPFIEDASATGNVGLESDGDFAYNPSTGTVTATVFKGNIDAVDGDFDGTLEADAITVNGTALDEFIQDTVGAMVSSNTEAGISVTYEDSDGTLDFTLAAVGTSAISDDAVTVAKIEDLARGQIIYGNASNETAKLSPGSANQVLTSDGQDISWQNASGGGATLDLNLILHTQVFGR